MCTAVTYKTKCSYFGRNLDLEYSYHETVTIVPRNYEIEFCKKGKMKQHFAMIGMAYVKDDYPLYYDATNEKGLSMAGLNFPENATYYKEKEEMDNIAPFELILWILGQCATVEEAKTLLARINIVDVPFCNELPLTPLHWLIADKESAITVETMADGMKIYENPVGVLTNNPPFPYHMMRLNDFMSLTKKSPDNAFSDKIQLKCYSRGMGALGLPGDWSSTSRFVRASFVKCNSVSGDSETESVNQFFHILGSVEMPRGCVLADAGQNDITIYSSCCNADKGIYYYTTYENRQINGVNMHGENLEGKELIFYELTRNEIQ